MSDSTGRHRKGTSKSGNPIYGYSDRPTEPEPAFGDESLVNAVSQHLEATLGKVDWVFHELLSDTIHVDVHLVEPTEERPVWTLVTSGMAERPMQAPAGAEACEFAELAVCLPLDWPGLNNAELAATPAEWKDEANYWPIRWLKMLARFPHEYQTWLWLDHSMPNGDPPQPFAANTPFAGMMLALNPMLGEPFHRLRVGDRDILFLSLQPLYPQEMQYKLDHGAEALNRLFDEHGVMPMVDNARPCVVPGKKKWWKPF
jgi:hypothetical protein